MISNRLNRLIGAKQWSIKRLAREAGVSYSTLHPLVRRQTARLDFETLNKLCIALECQPGDILEYRP